MSSGMELRTVAEFLAYSRLDSAKVSEDYVTLLADVGLDDVEGIGDVTDEDLVRWGMTKEMHRKRFIKNAAKCRLRDGGVLVVGTDTSSDEASELRRLRTDNETLRAEIETLRAGNETLLARLPTHPPGTPPQADADPKELPHLFISHSRRDPGALNAARLFAYAMKHAIDRALDKPFCRACYTGPRGGPAQEPHVTLWFDKEEIFGAENWPEVLADAQVNALATISFLSNAYLGSNECIKEMQFAEGERKPLIPFFLEPFVNSRQDFVDKHAKWRCDPELMDYKSWSKKKHYARKTANCLQGVPAFFDDLSVFTCDECHGKRDTVCATCTSWGTSLKGESRVKAEKAAVMLGQYIDHLYFHGKQPVQYDGPTRADGSPDTRMKRARQFEALQKFRSSRSVSTEEPGFSSLPAEVLNQVSKVEQTVSSPTPSSVANYDYIPAASMLSTLDLDEHKFPMHPSLTYFLQDMIAEKGTFRDPSGQEFETVQQCVPLKMVPIELWNDGSQKSKETLDGSEELLILRRRGYGPSTGYGGGRKTGRRDAATDVELDKLLERRPNGRGRATVVLGPAASGKTTMMHRLFVEQAAKAMRCKNSTEIVAPYILRVAELAKWLNGLPPSEVMRDLDASTLQRFLEHQHGGAGTPLATELAKLLGRNQLTLLFDGLDEAGVQQKLISRFIGNTLRSHFNGAIVVTSRESLFVCTDFKSNFDLVQIQPLTKELQQKIVERRFDGDAELESRNRFLKESGLLKDPSTEESVSLPEEMLENPLLLTMLIGVFKTEGRLPRTRSELYEQGIRQLILGRHAKEQVPDIVDFLRSLGHLVHVKLKKRDFTEREVMDHLGKQSKLLTLYSQATTQGVDSMKLEQALQSDEPEDSVIDLMVESAENGDQRESLRQQLETMSTVFDRAYDTGLLMCVDMNNSDNRTFRFTHLTFQEALAAAHCVAQLRAHLESVTDMFGSMFGTSPDPWLREVLLMAAEQMDEKLFEQLAVFFLDPKKDDGTGANAVHISSMLTARGENLQKPSGLGKKVFKMLSKLRSTEFMASTLELPSEQLRRLALKEIEEYTMPKAEISECLLQKLQQGAANLVHGSTAPWYVQTATVRSLGSLQFASQTVGSFLVDMCFGRPQRWHKGVVLEAVRALGNLALENQDCVVSKVLEALDAEELCETAVKTLIAPLRISEKRVAAKLKELVDQRRLSDDVVAAVQALERPVLFAAASDKLNFFSSTNKIDLRSPKPEPEPEAQPQSEPLPRPEPEPNPEPEPEPEPEPGSELPARDKIMHAYDPLVKVRKAIDKHLQDRSVLGGTDSINGGMEILSSLTPILRCMRKAQELAQIGMVRDQFEQFMNGDAGWWVGSLSPVSSPDRSTDSDRHAAAKVVWFFHELSLRLLLGNTEGWLDEVETKTILVRDGQRFKVNEFATFRGAETFKGKVITIVPDPSAEQPSRCRVTATVTSDAGTKPTVSESIELLAYEFLEMLEMDYKDNSMQTAKLLFGDSDKAGDEMGRLDDFVRPQFDQLVNQSPTSAMSFCSVLHYLRYHSARLLRCDPTGDANQRFRIGLEDELKQMPQQLAVFLRKELRVGSSELDRPYWIPSTEIEIVAESHSENAATPDRAAQAPDGSDMPDEFQQEALFRFMSVVDVELSQAQAFLEHRGWDFAQAINDYYAMKESEAQVPEGVPPGPGAAPTAAEEQVMSFTACSADEARKALQKCGGDVAEAIQIALDGGLKRSSFDVRYEHPFGRGSAVVTSHARTLEEFNTPVNIRDLQSKFSRDFGCRPEEVSLEVQSYDIHPEARGLVPEPSTGLIDYEIEHRERRHGVWGPWGSAAVQSNAENLEEFSNARHVRQLTRQYASETGNAVEDVEVRVIGYLHGSGTGSDVGGSGSMSSAGTSSSMSSPNHSGRHARRPGETESERAKRLGLIDYAVEHRQRRHGEWGPWRQSEVASNAPNLREFESPGNMRHLKRRTAAQLGVDEMDCEVRAIGYADPEQAEALGLLDPPGHTSPGRTTGTVSGHNTSSFLSTDSAPPIPPNPNAVPLASASTGATSSSGIAKVVAETGCSPQEAEAALGQWNGDVAKAIEEVRGQQLYD